MIEVSDLKRQLDPLRDALATAMLSVLDSGRFVHGEQVHRFESRFADYVGAAHAIGVANGTDALELALRAVGVGPGDRVATVANAGGYAVTAIHACGAEPLYVDVSEAHALIHPQAALGALAARPRAIVVTHLYGRMAQVETIARAAQELGVALVEDCAQAHGARRDGRHAGVIGNVGCFSFYPTKNLGALGDGGALVTGDEALAERLRRLRQYGWSRKYEVIEAGGINSRLDELQAAVLNVKLERLDAENERRRAIAAQLEQGIHHPEIGVPSRGGPDDVVHLFVVRCARREALRTHLQDHGVASDVHYPVPDHRQPAFAAMHASVPLPVTEALAGQVLSLPAHPMLTDAEVRRIVGACNSFPRR